MASEALQNHETPLMEIDRRLTGALDQFRASELDELVRHLSDSDQPRASRVQRLSRGRNAPALVDLLVELEASGSSIRALIRTGAASRARVLRRRHS